MERKPSLSSKDEVDEEESAYREAGVARTESEPLHLSWVSSISPLSDEEATSNFFFGLLSLLGGLFGALGLADVLPILTGYESVFVVAFELLVLGVVLAVIRKKCKAPMNIALHIHDGFLWSTRGTPPRAKKVCPWLEVQALEHTFDPTGKMNGVLLRDAAGTRLTRFGPMPEDQAKALLDWLTKNGARINEHLL